MIKHRGGCHCGKVRLTTEYDPLLVYQCNCQRCRRLMSVVNVGTFFGASEVEITGETKEYVTPGGSGLPFHYFFCPECGTRICGEAEAIEGVRMIPIGVYEDPTPFAPKLEVLREHKMKWIRDDGCIQASFEGMGLQERIEAMMENLEQRQ